MRTERENEARMFWMLSSDLTAARRSTAPDAAGEIGLIVDELECMKQWSTWPAMHERIDTLLAVPSARAVAVSAG